MELKKKHILSSLVPKLTPGCVFLAVFSMPLDFLFFLAVITNWPLTLYCNYKAFISTSF